MTLGWYFLIAVIVLGIGWGIFAIGHVLGQKCAEQNMKTQAVKRRHARWVVEDSGYVYFLWNETPKESQP